MVRIVCSINTCVRLFCSVTVVEFARELQPCMCFCVYSECTVKYNTGRKLHAFILRILKIYSAVIQCYFNLKYVF